MKTMTTSAVAALAAALLVSNALAQEDGGRPRREGPGPGMHRPMPPVIAALDANKDGVIDASEIANSSAALLTLDKDGDGKLSPQELMPPRPQGQEGDAPEARPRGQRDGNGPTGMEGRPRQPLPPVIAALDSNKDGTIDATEITQAAASLLTLDKDGDGKLSQKELRPPMRDHQGPPPAQE